MANVKLKTSTDEPFDLKVLLQETHNEALQKNEHATRHWIKVRDEHISLHSHLAILPHKLSQDVMVPIGSKALMRGKMVHTNEILVCLGDGWFVKCSAKQAAEICDRRIKLCDDMLKGLEREHNLLITRRDIALEQDAFGAESRSEIFEPYDKEKEEEWREQHRQKEKEYRQKLKELQNKEKETINDEESLWKRLDDLELQEELEEELDRLNAEHEEMAYEDENSNEDIDGTDEETENNDEDIDGTDEETEAMEANLIEDLLSRERVGGGNGIIRQDIKVSEQPSSVHTTETGDSSEVQSTQSVNQKPSGRRVSFADERTPKIKESDSDSDSSAEFLRIEFQHTPIEKHQGNEMSDNEHSMQTPADIHKHIKELMSKDVAPKSILKNKSIDIGSSGDAGFQRMQWLSQPDSVPIITQEMEEPLSNIVALQNSEEFDEPPVVFGDILEHSVNRPQPEPPTQNRPTSRFKAARLAAKR